jgi:hypothetical protein
MNDGDVVALGALSIGAFIFSASIKTPSYGALGVR